MNGPGVKRRTFITTLAGAELTAPETYPLRPDFEAATEADLARGDARS